MDIGSDTAERFAKIPLTPLKHCIVALQKTIYHIPSKAHYRPIQCTERNMQEAALDLFIELLPLIIGTAVVPSLIILVILFLQSDRGLLKASAFVGGMVSWRLFMLTIFVYYSYLFSVLFSLNVPERLHFVLLSLLGIILLIVATYILMKKGTGPVHPRAY
jgi:hypothetical protein